MNISIFGFGKVGTALGVALASKGHNIIGVDINEQIVKDINRGIAPFPEKNLETLLKQYSKNISATKDYEEATMGTETSFILAPTLSTKEGSFDNKYLYEIFEKNIPYLKEKKQSHSLILSSTVSPGSMEKFQEFLRENGLEEGENFDLYYNPAFIRQGSIIKDFLFPDVVLIGGSEETKNKKLEDFWRGIVGN